MNFRMMMQAGPAKANELFAKLSDTSDGAVKTREKLFAELKGELELHASLEEEHLFPILRKNAETRALVVDAIRDNTEMRAKLAELDALPKNDEAFPERLAELQKAFRQHARDEKKELLPAVQRALSTEQVQEVAEKIGAGLAEAEQAKQDEADERRAKARQEREQAQLEAEAAEREQQDLEAAEERRRKAARQAVDMALKPAEAAADTVQRVARLVTPQPEARGEADRRPAARTASAPLTSMLFWPWLGAMQASAPNMARGVASAEEVIPLGEEVLEVGKRTENRGTARIRRYVMETPVEQQVTLQSERVVVERRRPVTDKVTGEMLTDMTVEVVETEDVPVVEKRVRLREEIVVRTERTQRVETVRETVRRDEVEIRQPRKQPQLATTRAKD
jgi:iron-sulfur cluster repair protein YtfE (RIC family)